MLVSALIGAGAWATLDYHKHRVIVILPDGSAASDPSIILDYDPVYHYQPTLIHGRDGLAYIPRKKAYGRGWEIMKIYASRGGKRYGAQRYPSECTYPMTITLQELPPLVPPPPHSTFEQALGLLDIVRQIAK